MPSTLELRLIFVVNLNKDMQKEDKIYIAGHRGMVGGAINRCLVEQDYTNILFRTSKELDLRNQQTVQQFFEEEKPAYVFLAAAKVGGIMANNTYRAEFLYDNLMIETNIIHAAYESGVKKLMFLGSSCIYPKMAPQPLKEDYLLTGPLEYTNEPYAIAKIAGIKLCEAYRDQYGCNFISAMPTNLYGIGDNYHPKNSHVLPALIRKFHEAKEHNASSVTVWGSGNPMREFLYADDLAEACVFLMKNYNEKQFVNIGTGEDLTIKELALMIKSIVGFEGEIIFDASKPDGTPRKLMDVSKLNGLGWKYHTSLEAGIKVAYKDFLEKHVAANAVR
jgi:GDP-L-fucose synthase